MTSRLAQCRAAVLTLPTGSIRGSSWKLSAVVNTVAVICFSLVLLGTLAYGYSRGRALDSAFILYQGPCTTASTLNFIGHLVINILGTLILASSNFFMQIVAAPSRAELSQAHYLSHWLDIGAPSIRNFGHLSRFKRWSWIIFLVSSVPFHFLFNSVIFLVQSASSTFSVTWAGQPFVEGGDYYPPGGSLWNMEVPINCTQPANESIAAECSQLPVRPIWQQPNKISLSDYLNKSSRASLSISKAAAAQRNGWHVLDAQTCKQQYVKCGMGTGLQKYRDMVLIFTLPMSTLEYKNGAPQESAPYLASEWTRNQLFPNMTQQDRAFWDQLVPPDANNSLWYTSQCTMTQNFTTADQGFCSNTCAKFLGFREGFWGTQFESTNSTEVSDTVSLGGADDESYISRWYFNFWDTYLLDAGGLEHQMRSGYSNNAAWILVSYCLAEPVEGRCRIGISNTVLLIVTLCVLIKAIQCFIVLRKLVLTHGAHPLITLGDAIESLLRNPDPVTEDMCTLSRDDVVQAASESRKHLPGYKSVWTSIHGLFFTPPRSATLDEFPRPLARQWENHKRSYYRALRRRTWNATYLLFGFVLIVAAAFLLAATGFGKSQIMDARGELGDSSSNPFIMPNRGGNNYSGRFLDLVLLANVPQFIITVCYLQFNSIITRLHMAREWAALATGFRSLRVTEPKGEQTSTYRLQLPLTWSVPSIVVGILLHWLVSNSLYVYISDGGFYSTPMSRMQDRSLGISESGFIGLGYSPKAIFASFCLLLAVTLIPLGLGFWKIPPTSIIVGTNSLAISAACHASTLAASKSEKDFRTDYSPGIPPDESGSLLHPSGGNSVSPTVVQDEDHRRRAARSAVLERLVTTKIKWGVVTMPPEFYKELATHSRLDKVGHLSFGSQDDDVEGVEEHEWYV